MNTIGKKIKMLRVNQDLSLKELGLIIGLSDTALSNIESGKTKNIAIETGKELAKALNVSFSELFEINPSTDAGIVELKKENAALKKENTALKMDLELYRERISFYKEHRMLKAPSLDKPDDFYELGNDKMLLKHLEERDKKTKEFYESILKNPRIKAIIDEDLKDENSWYTQMNNEKNSEGDKTPEVLP